MGIFVKGCGFLSFAKNEGKNLNSKYSQKLIDHPKQFATDAFKTASKKEIQKTVEATGDLIGNTIADAVWSETSATRTKMYNNKITNTLSQNVSETNSINGLNTTSQAKRCNAKGKIHTTCHIYIPYQISKNNKFF